MNGPFRGSFHGAARLSSVRRAERLNDRAYGERMTTTDDTGLGPWVWKNDQDGYDRWIERMMRDMPESWDGDHAAEDAIAEYVRVLEQRVVAAYGMDGLERDHDGVAEAMVAMQEMRAIVDYMEANFPETHARDNPAAAVIRLLGVVQSIAGGLAHVVHATMPVVMQVKHIMKKEGLIK